MKKGFLSKVLALTLSSSIIISNAVIVSANETDRTFTDVNPSRWSAPYIESFYEKGYISGYPDGTFKPKEFITRAEVSAIFAKVGIDETKEGLEFVDVSPNEWYYDEINTITKIGLASGYPDGSFKPNNLLTRNEAFKVAATTFKNTDVSSINPDFVDQDTVASWAEIYEKHLMYYDVLGGFPDNSVRGDSNITREEFVKLLFHIINDENISETITESIASWDSYYEQINNDGQTGEVVPPVLPPVTPPVEPPKPSEKPSSNGGDNSGNSDDSSDTLVSRVPVINSITAGDNSISGTGISGSIIIVIMPNNKIYNTTVGTDNKWSVSIAETLVKDDVVKATQTESGRTVSAIATATVSEKPLSEKPVINDVTEGDKSVSGTGISGSEITVTMPSGKTYTATVGSDNKWSVIITENVVKDNVIKATQTENNKNSSDTTTTTVKELILLGVARASLTEKDLLGPGTLNTKTGATYPHYGTDKPVISDEIIITLNDKYSNATVEYYALTTADTTNYTIANLPSGTPTPLSLTDGKGRITGLANGDKYVIVSTGKYNAEQKSALSTIVINNIRDGSKENPIAIYDKDTLRSIPNGSTLYYDQISDINLAGVTWDSAITSSFNGSYYGNKLKIENLNGSAGLFGQISGATIDGINIEADDLTDVSIPFGLIAGPATNSKLSNITATLSGTMTCGSSSGLVVGVLSGGSAEHIVVNINGTISGDAQIGGFAGLLTKSSTTPTLDDITVTIKDGASISSTNANIGGICGVSNGAITTDLKVYNNGRIRAHTLVGSAFGTFSTDSSADGVTIVNSETSVIESYNFNSYDYSEFAGGFSGSSGGATISNINVTNRGKIIALDNVGGLFGQITSGEIFNYSCNNAVNALESTGGTNIGNYYGLNSGATFDPEVTTEMNTVVSE